MDRAKIAEWILRRLVSPTRAAEIVGDQLETRPYAGALRFWLSWVGVVIALTWRSAIGVMIAALASFFLAWLPFVYALFHLSFRPELSFYTEHAGFYLFFGMLLWIAAIFSLVRFGPRSKVAISALTAALLGAVATCTCWLPHAFVIQSIVASLLVVAALITSGGRKVLGVLIPSVIAGDAMLFLIGKLPFNGRTPGILMILLCEILTVTLVECGALSWTHRQLTSHAE